MSLSNSIVALAVALPVLVEAQVSSPPPLELQRLASAITLDGTPDEPAWQSIDPLPLTMYAPVFQGTPTQRTEIRVAYDDGFLYAAGWFYDSEPQRIRVNSLYRDRWNGDDAFAIYIDTFNDNRNSKWFGTTPAGMRFDVLVSDDGATTNGSWDTFWESRSTITDEGWFAEVRIPFSSLGFQSDANGDAVMGLTVTRLVSRIQERVTFPAIDPKSEFRRPSVAHDIVLRDVRTRRPLYVTPYALTGVARAAVLDPVSGFETDRETSREVGVDVRYPISSELTIDLTYNTDFAQVEADDQQVNLDRFPLFYPERRRFFQEGSGVFDYVGHGYRLFHSRRIGLASDFTPVPVLGGARLVGRVGKWDVGALAMATEEYGVAPAERFGVLRLRRPVLNPFSTAGVMVTSYGGDGRQNHAAGADATLRLFGDEYLTTRWAATFDDAHPDGLSVADRSLIDAKWERRTGRGLAYTAMVTRAGAAFDPELGFLPRRDFTSVNVFGNWFRFTDGHPFLRRIFPGALAFQTFRNADGVLESAQWAFWVQWETKDGAGGWVEPKWFREDVVAPFTIGRRITIPAGTYDFADLQLVITMPFGRRLRSNVDFRSGTYFDGTRTQVVVGPTWNASRHLELGADYQISRLDFASRGQHENVQLARLRIRTALDATKFGNAFLQYNSTTGRLDLNARLRWAVAEGTDLWLVYNEGLDVEREAELVGTPPLSLARSFILKYTHTFGL